MIHVSLDSGNEAAERWGIKEKFPWLTVLPEDVKKTGFKKAYKTTNSVPEYHLVNSAGETVVAGSSGSSRVFAKIKEIGLE